MSSYVDVDRSAEALQEDEELIEAVEQIVAKGAEAIITDVKNDVSSFYEQVKSIFDRVFPFLVYWRADPTLFWVDMEHLAIAAALFVVFFLFLSPWQQNTNSSRGRTESHDRSKGKNGIRRQSSSYDRLLQFCNLSVFSNGSRKRSQQNSLERSKSTSSILYAAMNSTSEIYQSNSFWSNKEMDDAEDDETENFAKRWPTILETPYRHLVIPPDCKRVERPKNTSLSAIKGVAKTSRSSTSSEQLECTKKSTIESTNNVDTSKNKDSTDDHPWNRLVNYLKHLFHLIMLFRRYDYAGAGWTLINWFQAALRARSRQNQTSADDEEEDEQSVASSIVSSSLDQDDFNGRFKAGSGRVTRKEKRGNGSTTPVAGNRSKVSPRTFRSKKEKTKQIVPSMPNMDHDGSSDDTMAIQSTSDNHRFVEEHEAATEVSSNTLDNKAYEARSDQLGNPASIYEEEEKAITLYDDENLIQTPPYHSQIRGMETPTFHTPLREPHLPPLDTTGESQSKSPLTALSSLLNPSKASLINGHSSSKSSSLTSNRTKTRDALENYRTGGTRTWTGQFHPVPVKVSSAHNDDPTSARRKYSMDRQDSGRNASYYFDSAETRENLKKMVVEVPVPDRNGYIVGDEFLPDNNFTPLLAFVNSRSGPQQGHLLITQLRGLLNPIQVWDLADGGPEEILYSFSAFTRLRILVCGGDGTVSWIVSTIERMKLQRWPPIAILPLGTGNDLARIHGWGGGYNNESLIRILEQVSAGYISWLDRWEMTVENKKGKVKEVKSFFNYLGVGADAQAALQVHMLRESRPQLFFSRLVNKAWYGVFGAEDIIKATSINLPNDITLIADGVEIPLPADSQGIILLNIDSYAGGVALWSSGHKANIPADKEKENLFPMKRSKSLDALGSLKKHPRTRLDNNKSSLSKTPPVVPSRTFDRIDSTEDIASLALTDEEMYERVTACDRPSSCQDGYLDIVSIRGAFHLGQIRVGLSTARKLCQCREATIIIKRKVSVQIDGEPWRQNVCTLKVRRKKDAAIMLHRSTDEGNGVETEMAKLLDWAEERKLIDEKVHAALMKEFSRRIESKTRQRRKKENLMCTLKRAMKSGTSSMDSSSFLGGNGIHGSSSGNRLGISF